MQPEVSVIIPVYNVEKYLESSIESVLKQTYNNIQIVLVDDGATDKSPEICEQFAQKNNNIRVIHKKNGGLSDARNAGIKVATGKYILFLDSDDTLLDRAIEDMVNIAEKNNCDAVIPNIYYKVYESNFEKQLASHFLSNDFYEDPNIFLLNIVIGKGRARRATAVLYKAYIIQKKEIFFRKDTISEDVFFTIDYLSKCHKISMYSKPSLYNLKRENSISASYYSDFFQTILRMDRLVKDYIEALPDTYNILAKGKRELLLFRNVMIFVIQVMTEESGSYRVRKNKALFYLKHESFLCAVREINDIPFFDAAIKRMYFKIVLAALKLKRFSLVCLLSYIAGIVNK